MSLVEGVHCCADMTLDSDHCATRQTKNVRSGKRRRRVDLLVVSGDPLVVQQVLHGQPAFWINGQETCVTEEQWWSWCEVNGRKGKKAFQIKTISNKKAHQLVGQCEMRQHSSQNDRH